MPLAGRPFPQRRRVPGRCECVRLLDVRERFSELCARHAGHTLSAYFLGFHVIPLISTVSGHGPSHCHRRGSGHRIVARPHAVHGPSHAVHGCWLAEAKACGFTAHGGLLLQLNGLWLRARRARQRGATSSDVRGMPWARPKFAPARAAGSRRKRAANRPLYHPPAKGPGLATTSRAASARLWWDASSAPAARCARSSSPP